MEENSIDERSSQTKETYNKLVLEWILQHFCLNLCDPALINGTFFNVAKNSFNVLISFVTSRKRYHLF